MPWYRTWSFVGSRISALRVFRVRADDVPHQPVAHDVRLREIAERDALDARQNALHLEQSRVLRFVRSIWVLSPVITAREFTPRRVRNIFICIPVAFCASSRITNASDSVRPRMYASGAISIIRDSIAFCTRSRGIMSSSASYSGRR